MNDVDMMMTLDSINLELTSNCNLFCEFCPLNTAMEREKGIEMPFECFKNIIDQAKELGLSRVYLFLFGEPLLCSWFEKGIDYCGEKGIQDIHITTNGALLNERKSEAVLRNVAGITFSVTGVSQKVYECFQGYKSRFSLEVIERNIKKFIELRDKRNKYVPINLYYALDKRSIPEWRMFYNKWVHVVDELVFADMQEYDLTHFKLNNGKIRPCSEIIARNKLNFLSNGEVTVCCEDFNTRLSLGNVKASSVGELWNNKKGKDLRKIFQNLNFSSLPSVCQNCYMICRYLNFITSIHIKASDRMLDYINTYFPSKKIMVYGANSLTAAMLYNEDLSKRIVAVIDEHRMEHFVNKEVISFDEQNNFNYDVLIVNLESTGKNTGLTKNQLYMELKERKIDRDKMIIYHSSAGGTDLKGSDIKQMADWIMG